MPLGVAPQLRYGGAWNILPAYAADGPTVVERGYTDEGTIRPSTLKMRINDAAAPTLNPSRPASLLYGITGRAMPAALGVDGSVRSWTECATIDPDQTPDYVEGSGRGKRWLDVEAAGPLYRIGQWSEDLQSPMTRTFLQYASLIGFWPGDDAGISTRVGYGRSITDVTAMDSSAPPGASASFVATATTSAVFSPLNASTTAGFQVFWSARLPTLTAVPIQFFSWRANGLLWVMMADNTSFGILIYLYRGGALVDSWSTAFGGVTDPAGWIAWRAKVSQNGANIRLELAWYGGSQVYGATHDFAGTVDRLTSIRLTGGAGTKYSEVGALSGTSDDLQSLPVLRSFNGWSGETTAARFTRLLTESGVPNAVQGTATTLMGAQKAGRLMDLIKECAATEDGLVFDQRDQLQTVFRTRRSRMNQTVALTLSATVDVVPPFKERVDNVGVANVVTITDRSGSTYTATRTTGSMSSAAYPTGIGTFKGGALPDVSVNLADPAGELPRMASWYLARGTVPGPRWPTVTVEIGLRSPGLRAAVKAIEIGDRIQVTGRMADPIDLHVIGVREEVGTHRWEVTFTCIPGVVFDTGAEDDTGHRLDAYASTIITAPAPATTGTSLVVGSPDPDDVWSTSSLPYPIMIAGEKLTVTACTAAVLTSGTYRQTLTVTRSVNGIVKAQVAGSAVSVFAPYREGW